ncbi:MAG: CDP-diacylglycerol--glycerol-3-phosphate 3-phosphatidyltransferase [Acholeplasmatales bacterium]|jgi:CDP-diacylglycerol--glycerol-3-phosphate 3-phosphatidyltransferase|nr:CDP-diacylglycerol--glycerol-3-phosphate 3-phosphatidyltransferase [Acholeplasmatales bacterium]
MTLPNKITIFRILIIPVMVVLIYIKPLNDIKTIFEMSLSQLLFACLFIIGSLSDLLDGYLARKLNKVTTFGKFLDPIADKLLTIASFLYLVKIGNIEMWILLVILFREFIVSGIRMLTAARNIIIPADIWGKIKTTFTMISLIFILFNEFGLKELTKVDVLVPYFGNIGLVSIVLLLITVVLTLQSGINYFIKSKDIVLESI